MNDPLDVLLEDGVIDEVLGRLKSGKEATISLVRRGDAVLAAKVYKDQATRSFKSNAEYKEGRKVRNSRTQRAIERGGRFGADAAEEAWKSAEADALYKLVGTGVRVPRPVMFYEGVLLMELVVGDDGRPAPRLIDVALDPGAALRIFADLVAQIIALLCKDLVHGDLSPYNILAAAAGPTIIDFPQVVSAAHNTRAEFFFLRDFDNVVRYTAGFDPAILAHRNDGRAIWRAYVARELTEDFVPPPAPPPQAQRPQRTRGPDRRPGPRPRPDQRSAPGRGDPRPPPGRGDQRAPQGRGDQRAPQGRGDQRPSQGRDDQRPPSSGRPDQRPPASGRPDQRPWQGRPDQRPPASGRPDQRPPASGRTDPRPPARTDARPPPRADARPPPRRDGPPGGRPAMPQPGGGHRRRPKRRF